MEETVSYPWMHNNRYNDFSTYFRNKFSGRVQKISIDAGFTCPNRDGKKGYGGCTYCNNKTFNPSYCDLKESITEQLEKGIQFFSKKYKSINYLAYFQAYSNSYAPIQILKSMYEEALKHPMVIGLVIATRPDCLNSEVLDYLAQLSIDKHIMIEIGVESHVDKTLERINRGHTFAESVYAIEEISKRGLSSCVHLIIGLPGESRQDFLDQAKTISQLPVQNIKLHQLQIHKNTLMAMQYEKNPEEFNLFFDMEEYIEIVVDYLELLNPNIVVERFVSQSPKELLIAPAWGIKNFEFVAKVEKRLKVRNTWQGRLYK